jgi:hypothetical protein
VLNKLNVKVKLEDFQPHQTHLFNIKAGKKKKQIVYERKKIGKWAWTEKATKIEKTEEKNIVAPTTDISSGTEAIEKAKLFRAISKKGFMVVPCDVQEPGTREILDLATDVPVLIPSTYIERENATLWEARRERKRDWVGIRYDSASEAGKYRAKFQLLLQKDPKGWSQLWNRATRLEKVEEEKHEKLKQLLDYFCLIGQSDLEEKAIYGRVEADDKEDIQVQRRGRKTPI